MASWSSGVGHWKACAVATRATHLPDRPSASAAAFQVCDRAIAAACLTRQDRLDDGPNHRFRRWISPMPVKAKHHRKVEIEKKKARRAIPRAGPVASAGQHRRRAQDAEEGRRQGPRRQGDKVGLALSRAFRRPKRRASSRPAGLMPRGFARVGTGQLGLVCKKCAMRPRRPATFKGVGPIDEPLPPPSLRASSSEVERGDAPRRQSQRHDPRLPWRSRRWTRPWNELMPPSGPERSLRSLQPQHGRAPDMCGGMTRAIGTAQRVRG